MSIKVQCACGKAFAAKDELAGKTVKCPGCQKPLKIPGGTTPQTGGAKPQKSAATPQKPTAKPTSSSTSSRPSGVSDLFDEAGLQAAAKNTTPCPGCREPLAPDAVVCIKCGYNMKMGRRMQTVKVGGDSDGIVGHGAIAQDLMDKAAQVIDEDHVAEATKTKEGMPWWVYLIVFIVLIGLAAYMLNRSGGNEESKDGKKAWLNHRDPSAALA